MLRATLHKKRLGTMRFSFAAMLMLFRFITIFLLVTSSLGFAKLFIETGVGSG